MILPPTKPFDRPLPKIKAGYIRVSTLVQEDESLSLDRQRAAVEAAGATLIFKDVDSGSNTDRQSLKHLMERVRRGEIDEVIVSRIDRLTRSLRQLLDLISEFERLGVNLKILDMNIDLRTPMGKFMVMLIGMFAEWETDQLSERIKSERRQRRQKLIASSSCPFGYKVKNGKYILDHQKLLCLLSDRPENYATEDDFKNTKYFDETRYFDQRESSEDPEDFEGVPDAEKFFRGRTVYQLCREVVELFLEDTLPRTTLGQFFEKYGIEKPPYRSGGAGRRLYWTPSGFLSWLTNPVLQGHTVYLRQITVSKRQRETNPDGPEIHYNTHPTQRLISKEENQEIGEIIEMNRQLGGGNFKETRNKRNQHVEYAYQTGLIYCAQCHSRCTSKTSSNGKYRYFACRYSGTGCSNKKSVPKSTIEQVLIQHLVTKSQEMREAAWDAKRGYVNSAVVALQASGADDEEVRQFLLDSEARYEDLEEAPSLSTEQASRIQRLEAQLQDFENLRIYNPEIELLKQKTRQELEEARMASQSLLEKTAGEIIFEGNTSYFWDGLTNEDKSRVFKKIVPKIFINQGKVTEILLKMEQTEEQNDEYEGTSESEGEDYQDRAE